MLTVAHLSTDHPRPRSLQDISLEVPAGSVLGIYGPSGSGKSTLARTLALVDEPTEGSIAVNGTDLLSNPKAVRAAREQIAFVGAAAELQPQRTTAGNVAIPFESTNVSAAVRRDRITSLLDLVGLSPYAQSHPDQLTAAQRQRVLIAQALAGDPAVLVLEEPVTDLAADGAEALLTVLERVRAELGLTIVLTTDQPAVLRRLADHVAVLREGRLLESGRLLDLAVQPGTQVSAELLGEVKQSHLDGAREHDVLAETVLVGFAAVGALLPEATSRFGVQLSILGGGLTRLGETPVAKFQIGLSGQSAESALSWMVERGAHVRRAPVAVESTALDNTGIVPGGSRITREPAAVLAGRAA